MKLIVGLGNPGEKYADTRHNAGSWLVGELRGSYVSASENRSLAPSQMQAPFARQRRAQGSAALRAQLLAKVSLQRRGVTGGEENLLWVESLGAWVNKSGPAIKKLLQKHKAGLENLVVVHDDLDLALGEFKLQKGRGAAGHKGVGSVIEALGSQDFWRLRVGIGRPPEGVEAEDYVLDQLSVPEREVLTGLVELIKRSLIVDS